MSPRVLVVSHPRSESGARLRDAVLAGVADGGCESVALHAPDAGPEDVRAADGVVIVTPANFGAVSGLVKDFLERIYPWFEEVPDMRPGMPYVLVARGASDASGAVRDVTRILHGLRWKEVAPPVVVEGPVEQEHVAAAREVGAVLAAGLEAGMW